MWPTDWTTDIIIPVLIAFLGIIGVLWTKIQAWHRGITFQKLIFRELEEFNPFIGNSNMDIDEFINKLKTTPIHDMEMKKKWTDYYQGEKTFIHTRIFHNPTENRDFILSLNPTLVYCVSQLWSEIRLQKESKSPNPDGEPFRHYFKSIAAYARGKNRFGIHSEEKGYPKWVKLIQRRYRNADEIQKVCDRWNTIIQVYNRTKTE